MGLKRLLGFSEVYREWEIDLSTFDKVEHYAWEELAGLGGKPEISVIPIGRRSFGSECDIKMILLIVRDKTRPLGAATMYVSHQRCPRISKKEIKSRWNEDDEIERSNWIMGHGDDEAAHREWNLRYGKNDEMVRRDLMLDDEDNEPPF